MDKNHLEAAAKINLAISNSVMALISQTGKDANPNTDQKEKDRQLSVNQYMYNHLQIIGKYLQTMFQHGLPRELIFIDESGNKIDLVLDRTLDENELTNIILDNTKK